MILYNHMDQLPPMDKELFQQVLFCLFFLKHTQLLEL